MYAGQSKTWNVKYKVYSLQCKHYRRKHGTYKMQKSTKNCVGAVCEFPHSAIFRQRNTPIVQNAHASDTEL